MRILAHMTKDKKLQQFFNEGKDIHLLISSYALGKPIEKVTQEERSSFKQVVFGILYGMGMKEKKRVEKNQRKETKTIDRTRKKTSEKKKESFEQKRSEGKAPIRNSHCGTEF